MMFSNKYFITVLVLFFLYMADNRCNFGLEFAYPNEDIYFDSASLGRLPISSINKIQEFYERNIGGTVRGTHRLAIEASRFLEEKRKTLAEIFSITPNQVAFLPSREVAILNSLFYLQKARGNKILTSVLEDHSILAPLIKFCDMSNLEIEYLSLKDEQNLTDKLNDKITSETKAMILSSQSLGIGAKRDWKHIVRICKDKEIPFILDISNSIGHEPFDFGNQIPDIVLSSGSSGALGPPGTAFQILAEEIENDFEPLVVGGGSIVSLDKNSFKLLSGSSKYEPGQLNLAGITGMVNSISELNKIGFKKIETYETKLRNLIVDGIKNTSNITLIEGNDIKYGPIISFISEEIDAHDIAIILEDMGKVYVRSGALCSHIFMDEINRDALVQVSTHIYNTEEDVNNFIELLKSIMDEF